MPTLPLTLTDGHLFVDVDGDRWLLDTGAPSSFGARRALTLAGERFDLDDAMLGLNAEVLSEYVGVSCTGLLGADVLNGFDHRIDVPGGVLTLTTDSLAHEGEALPVELFMGIPVVTARVGERAHRMFFDTGAQLSYLQHDALGSYPPAGTVTDFYPGVGRFETDTHQVPVALGALTFSLRCGSLPMLLGMTLMMAGTEGIIGNTVLQDRPVCYAPRRGVLVL
jgi:hypothetical protein